MAHQHQDVLDHNGKAVLTSARVEALLIIWRVREALEALPQAADRLTIRRWNHGIARELVRMIA